MLYRLLSETYSCVGTVQEARTMQQSAGSERRVLHMVLATTVLVGVTLVFVIIGATGN